MPIAVAEKMTAAEFARLDRRPGQLYELLDGELVGSPSPSYWHQVVLKNLVVLVETFLRSRGSDLHLLFAPFDVQLSEFSVVEPDMMLYAGQPPEAGSGDKLPLLVVEVLSPGTQRRDLGRKRELFARSGVQHYWAIEPIQRWAVAYELENGTYVERARGEVGDLFVAAPLAELQIQLDELWS